MPELHILIGMPASGKSTLRKTLQAQLEPVFVYSTDDVVEQIAAEQRKTYRDVWETNVKYAETKMNEALQLAIVSRCNVIWDQTNLNPKKRQAIRDKFAGKNYVVHYHLVEEHPKVLLERNNARRAEGRDIPQSVLNTMINSFDWKVGEANGASIHFHGDYDVFEQRVTLGVSVNG